jgi:hypothetical protein
MLTALRLAKFLIEKKRGATATSDDQMLHETMKNLVGQYSEFKSSKTKRSPKKPSKLPLIVC